MEILLFFILGVVILDLSLTIALGFLVIDVVSDFGTFDTDRVVQIVRQESERIQREIKNGKSGN